MANDKPTPGDTGADADVDQAAPATFESVWDEPAGETPTPGEPAAPLAPAAPAATPPPAEDAQPAAATAPPAAQETAEQTAQRLADTADKKQQAAAAADAWWARVTKNHPDAEDISASAGFRTWLAGQDAGTQADANGDPADAVAVLSKYKAHIAQDSAGRSQKPPASSTQAVALADFLRTNPIAAQEIEYVDDTGTRTKGTLADFMTSEKGYPDVFSAMWRVQQAFIQQQMDSQAKAIEKMIAQKGFVTRADIAGITTRMTDLDLMQANADAPRIRQSPEYAAWRDKLAEPIKRLHNGTADERLALVNLFRTQTGTADPDPRRARQHERDALHGHTLRAGQRPTAPAGSTASSPPETTEEAEARFAEEFNKE